jgi:hypothetical protein
MHTNKLNKILLTFFSCLFLANSYAQDSADQKSYVGAEYAFIKFKNQSSIASVLVSAVGGSATSTQDTGITVTRFFGGYSFTENVGAELGYIASSTANATFSGVSRTSVSYSGTAQYSLTGVDYSAVLRPEKASSLNGLFLKLGMHSISAQNNVSVVTGSGSGAASSKVTGSGTLVGIGYEQTISSNAAARYSYSIYDKLAGVSGSSASFFTVSVVYKF